MRLPSVLMLASVLAAAEPAPPPGATALIIPNAHLDTQWMWTGVDTIEKHLPKTLDDNTALLAAHPGYRFAFEQAIHYRWIEELQPQRFAWLRAQVASGRWHPSGGAVVAGDVNIAAPETLIRQYLLGTRWFQDRFAIRNRAAFLPDCFGFSAAFPAVLAHCGYDGLITGKITYTWAGYNPPFHIGDWTGIDGSRVTLVMMRNYGNNYKTAPREDAKKLQDWAASMARDGIPLVVATLGRGDDGGAADEASVRNILAGGTDRVAVELADPDQVVARIRAGGPAKRVHNGDLLLRRHGTGAFTSHAAVKRLDRLAGESLQAAEHLSLLAERLTGLPYPDQALRAAWWRMLWHQFHDDLPGTSIAPAYHHTYDDLYATIAEADAISRGALAAVAARADTSGPGVPVLVANPLTVARREVVELAIPWPDPAPAAVTVRDGAGVPVPVQVLGLTDGRLGLAAVPSVPALGFTVLSVQAAGQPADPAVAAGPRHLDNGLIRVELDDQGRISVITGAGGRAWLAAPAGLQLLRDDHVSWPAWEVDADDLASPPLAWDAATIRLVEQGPARAVLQVEQQAVGVRAVTRIGLSAGASQVDLDLDIDWQRPGALLKFAAPFAIDPETTWDDSGVLPLPRGRNRPVQDEVPHQQWTGLAGADGFRVALLNDGRCGRDRPAGGTLRVSLVRTPATHDKMNGFPVLAMQDLGRHRVRLAIAGGQGADWPASGIPARAAALNRPLVAVVPTRPGPGPLGRHGSWLRVPAPAVIKHAEDGDGVIVRWIGDGTGPQAMETPIAVVAMNGLEEPLTGPAIGAFTSQRWRLPTPPVSPVQAVTVALTPDLDGVATPEQPGDGDLTGRGEAYLGTAWPAVVRCDGVDFTLPPPAPGAATLRRWRGNLDLPRPAAAGEALWLLASADGPRPVSAAIDGRTLTLHLPDWQGSLGRWFSPVVPGRPVFDQPPQPLSDIRPGWEPPADLRPAWIGAHSVSAGAVRPLRQGHLALVRIPLPAGAQRVALVEAPAWIAAAALVAGPAAVLPASAIRWP